MKSFEEYTKEAFPGVIVHPLPDYRGAKVFMVTEFGTECAATYFRVIKDGREFESGSLEFLLTEKVFRR